MKTALLKGFALLIVSAALIAAQPFQDGWSKYTTQEGTLSLSLPPQYLLTNSDDPTAQAEYEKIRQNNPKMAKMMDEKPQNAILSAVNMDEVMTGKVGVVQVMKSPNGGLTHAMYGAVAKEIAKGLTMKGKLEHKIVDLPVGKTLTYWGTMILNTEAGKQEMDILAYLFLKGEDLYILQFVSEAGGLKANRETWEKIAKSAKTN